MPSVASHVSAAIAQHRDAKVSSSASNADDRADASPFAEMLESSGTSNEPAKGPKADAQSKGTAKTSDTVTSKDQSSSPAEPAAKDAVGLQAAVEVNVAKTVEAAVDPGLVSALTSEATPAPHPAQTEPPQVDLAAFMQAVAAATQPKPQVAQEERETPADKPQADDAKATDAAPASDEAASQPAVVQAVAVVQPDAVAVPVAPALPVDPGADAVPQPAADKATTPLAQVTSSDTAKPAPALPETGKAVAPKAPEKTEPITTLPAEATPEPQETVAANPAAALAVSKPGKHEAHKADAPAAHLAKSETASRSDGSAPAAETPVAPGVETKPAPTATAEHHAAHKARETADAPAKVDIADLASAQKAADSNPALTLPPQASATAVSATTAVSPQKDASTSAASVPIDGVAVEIAARAIEGKHHFDIRLDPPELGRIHVRLDIDRNGEITSRVMTDRQDTLDLLRRDAPQLERALNDAGLRTAGNGLQFSLRDHGQGQREQTYFADAARLIVKDDNLAAEAQSRGYYRPAGAAGGIDIRV